MAYGVFTTAMTIVVPSIVEFRDKNGNNKFDAKTDEIVQTIDLMS